MKIYLDTNLCLSSVDTEEFTQDSVGYNIIKLYVPDSVVSSYDAFTAYYGAVLPNSRKVGYFGMTSYDSSDSDYVSDYTLFKATLESVIVSVPGKVALGFQLLMSNTGDTVVTKKNSAVVMLNVRKSVAINNDILILDEDDTTTDVLESYKNLLQTAMLTYVTQANQAVSVTTQALTASNSFTSNGTSEFNGESTFYDDIAVNSADIVQTNGNFTTNGNVEANSFSIGGTNIKELVLNYYEITANDFTVNGDILTFNSDVANMITSMEYCFKVNSGALNGGNGIADGYYYPTLKTTVSGVTDYVYTSSSFDFDLCMRRVTFQESNNVVTVHTNDIQTATISNIMHAEQGKLGLVNRDDGGYVTYTTAMTINGADTISSLVTPTATITKNGNNEVKRIEIDSNVSLDYDVFSSDDVVDNLTTASTTKALSANQGKVLNDNHTTLASTVSNIQSEISTLKSVQNVIDVVADLTALNNYSTTSVETNDKVQVISDSNHDNKSTIYNWNGSSWAYVGTFGNNTYTKTETDTLLADKMDKNNAKATGTFKLNAGTVSGNYAVAMNGGNARGDYSFAFGEVTGARGDYSFAFGYGAEAYNNYSYAFGYSAIARNDYSMALGFYTMAAGNYSMALGYGTKANGDSQLVFGENNLSDSTSLEIVGNGDYSNSTYSNARLLDSNGDEYLAGDLYINTTFTGSGSGSLSSKSGTSVRSALASANNTITTLQNKVADLEQETANLKQSATGNTMQEVTTSGLAYTYTIPSATLQYGYLNKVGGMSYKSENLIGLADVAETTINDVTYKVENGVITLNGTCNDDSTFIQIPINPYTTLNAQYYTFALFNNVGNTTILGIRLGSGSTTINDLQLTSTQLGTTNAYITKQMQSTAEINTLIIRCNTSTTFTNYSFTPMLVQGSTAPTTYKPYFSGIRHTAPTSVSTYDSNSALVGTKPIPASVQALDGYGWGLSQSVNNYADFDNKTFTKMVGMVDLSTLSWSYHDGTLLFFQCSDLSSLVKNVTNSTIANMVCAIYTNATANDTYNNVTDKTISITSTGLIQIYDTSYTDPATFKSAMSGVYLYYELATPVITDISSYLDDDFNVLSNLEGNGTLVFDNTYGQEAFYEIFTYEKL